MLREKIAEEIEGVQIELEPGPFGTTNPVLVNVDAVVDRILNLPEIAEALHRDRGPRANLLGRVKIDLNSSTNRG